MSNIVDIYQIEDVTEPEQLVLKEVFSNPVVAKYLRILAQNDTADFVRADLLKDSPELYARKHSQLQGKLAVIATLLSISTMKVGE